MSLYNKGMAKTNKEKLDKLYQDRRELALALGFSSASGLLTALTAAYQRGYRLEIFVHDDLRTPTYATAYKPLPVPTPQPAPEDE